MFFLVTLLCTLVVVTLVQPLMRKAPVAFYALAVALDVLYAASLAVALPYAVNTALVLLVRRGFLAVSLFVVVMYAGVLPHGSKVRRHFIAIRAVLAITACILALGHICTYFVPYAASVFGGTTSSAAIVAAILCGFVLVVLLAVLGVTSLRAVRRHMSGKAWLKLQKFAYLFYALIYAHLTLLLLPAALGGAGTARVNMAIYTAVFGVYLVARVARAVIDRNAKTKTVDLRTEEFAKQAL